MKKNTLIDNDFTNTLAQQDESPEQKQENNSQPVKHLRPMTTLEGLTVKFLAVLMVIGGMLLGIFMGSLWSFSDCWKDECSPVVGSSWLWIPIASLFFTVPLAKKIFRYVERSSAKAANDKVNHN